MDKKTLSVFVDESGRFRHPDSDSRFYIVSLVLHDQSVDIPSLSFTVSPLTESHWNVIIPIGLVLPCSLAE